jgi:hypothetical protein
MSGGKGRKLLPPMIENKLEDARRGASGVAPKDFVTELENAVRDAGFYADRANRGYDVRNCRWNGQSSDGRKHGEDLGRDAFPWEGASDARIRTADEIVNDEVRMMLTSFRRAGFQAVGIGTEDLEAGMRVSQLLRWQTQVAMRDQVRRELELAAQWREQYGSSVTCVQWEQQLRRVPRAFSMDDLAATVAAPMLPMAESEEQAAQILEEARMAVLDPLQEENMVGVLMTVFPLAKRGEALRALRVLRNGEMAELDEAEIFDGGPRWTALQTFVDVFFPVNTWDIQRARWVAHRELVSETDLRGRVLTEDYDEAWVEEAISKKGSSLVLGSLGGWAQGILSQRSGRPGILDGTADDAKDMVEVYHFYYKVTTDKGVPQVRKCVIHPGVQDREGWSGPLPYDHGLYPYVVHQREYLARCILESRGVAELADTWQQEIKAQRDSRVDRTSLTTLPPVLVPPSRGARRLQFGPGAQWPKRRGEEIEWMRIPPFDGASIEIEKATERSVDRYFGRISETNPPDRSVLYMQHLVDGWLGEMEQIGAMTLQLDQQYMPDEMAIRVMGRPIRMSRQEIQGKFDLQLVFDVRNLNGDMLKEKLQMINTLVLPLDQFGILDKAKMVQLTLGAVDPIMADLVLQSTEAASEQQVDDEQNVLAKMVAGMETRMDPAPGMNYGLRLQTLQQSIQANPELQQMIEARPVLRQMVEARLQFLSFQAQQQQNAQIGRMGATPVLPPVAGA